MIDAYLNGTVSRMSPEAPVPVVSIEDEIYKLGGAANVALNLKTLGADPIICSVIGKTKSERFLKLIRKNHFSEEGIVISEDRKTTQKTRVIDQSKHLLRVDEENTHDLTPREDADLKARIQSVLENTDISVVILQDYNKGVLTRDIINFTVSECNKRHIPTAVDPKLNNFFSYGGVSLFKPNLKELNEGLGVEISGSDIDRLKEACKKLEDKMTSRLTFITLSENGVLIKNGDSFSHFKAHHRNIVDVSGAGDTVISVAALCLAADTPAEVLAQLSNLAGGLVCEHVGVEPISKSALITSAEKELDVS